MKNENKKSHDSVSDPMWLDENRYLTVWAGYVIEVDKRRVHPLVPITEQLIRDSTVDLQAALSDALRHYKK